MQQTCPLPAKICAAKDRPLDAFDSNDFQAPTFACNIYEFAITLFFDIVIIADREHCAYAGAVRAIGACNLLNFFKPKAIITRIVPMLL